MAHLRKLTALLVVAAAGGASIASVLAQGRGAAPSQCSPASIGLARTIEIDTRGGPLYGQQQYPGFTPLKDREVILTFDDGPHKVFTQDVLDALDAHCTKATFFMVGQRALSYPEMVRKVAARGHTIATHTWSHQNLQKMSAEEATAEIELGISAVQKALGQPAAPFFRFPYLANSKATTAYLGQRNTGIFSIDLDSSDFKTRSPTVVIRNVMSQIESKRSGILLFHDIQPSTAGAINTLLGELKAAGYRVVHMVPKQGQTTVASYDQRVERELGGRRVASLPPPVAQRGIVSPAWEVRTDRPDGQPPRRNADVPWGVGPPSPPQGQPAPQPQPRPRLSPTDDWRQSVFRGW